MTRNLVINLRNDPRRTRPDVVYIGRPSKWGNNYSHLDESAAQFRVETRAEAIRRFEDDLRRNAEMLQDLRELRGRLLGCWCAPAPCHGHVLAHYANLSEDVLRGMIQRAIYGLL